MQGTKTATALALVSSVLAAAAWAFAPALTYGACWSVTLVLLAPCLHLSGPSAGSRALGWLALAPILGLVTWGSLSRALTAPWHWLCGTGQVEAALLLPFVVALLVLGWATFARVASRAVAERARLALVVVATIAMLGAQAVVGAIALGTPASPSPTALLRSSTHAIATLASDETRVAIDGAELVRDCDPECSLVADGIASDRVSREASALELAEGLGYRFVRAPGSDPSTWLAYRRGEPYGRQLDATELGQRVTAPAGIGGANVLVTAVALAYLVLASRRAWRIDRARRSAHVPTYRTAPHPTDLSCEWHALGQHTAMAFVLLVLGITPMLVVLCAGLAPTW